MASRTSVPATRSPAISGSGILPQPIPSRSNSCLAPRSASRQVRGLITAKSRPSVKGERSVSTNCTKSRPAPGGIGVIRASGWSGAATGTICTDPAVTDSIPTRPVASGPEMPTTASPSCTKATTAPNASTCKRSVTVG
ncbi:hypothetical protein D9M73_119840 [compost metagenome]